MKYNIDSNSDPDRQEISIRIRFFIILKQIFHDQLFFNILYVNQTKMAYVLVDMGNLASREYHLLMLGVFDNSFFIQNLNVRALV